MTSRRTKIATGIYSLPWGVAVGKFGTSFLTVLLLLAIGAVGFVCVQYVIVLLERRAK
ncbi:MAG: hypothetical protein UX19_C0006G0001 [Candidatus Woesebacteria bacterium GW2011_GWA1_45_8]|uniref:Uncharacterized protein n=1 Tax=Candidatus Woesebacteria bacterium GW2011_GWA1_45_8 TaxID=1618559 RepID=A0A0G1QU26_9BACT|nr:MAG: hypothetical protein UX19_C0006G0001 [Candidatus Woesebacteria bacterium GW2011_GWA1_45_8]